MAVIFLLLVPYVYGIHNLNNEKAADCLGKIVIFTGIPLFVSILKPEQNDDIRDVILTKAFSYRGNILFRMLFAMLLSAMMVYCFASYMLYQGCEFPIGIFTVRTVWISMLVGGMGLLGSALFRSTLAGFLLSIGFGFLFYDNFAVMVFAGVHGFVITVGTLLYGIILLVCNRY